MRLMAEPRVTVQQVEPAGLLRDFGSWMTAEQRRIYHLCQRMLRDPADADSATQDVFLKAYQDLQKRAVLEDDGQGFDDPGRWLTRIAVNTCLDRLRSQKWQFWRRRPSQEDEISILARTASRQPEADQKLMAGEISARLTDALGRLSDRQRAVFTLRHYDEMSLEEIANILGLDVGTVKAHMFRAVSKLREELKDLYGRSTS